VLLVSSHPVQYATPVYRLMAEHPRLEILVAYCSLGGAVESDPEFLTQSAFDGTAPEGYPWVLLPNRSPRPGLGTFFEVLNPGVDGLLGRRRFDCCVVFGYAYATLALAVLSARARGIATILGTDAIYLDAREGQQWKRLVKRIVLPVIYRSAEVVIVPSTAAREFVSSRGFPRERVVVTPYVVDNNAIASIAAASDRASIRRAWQVPEEATVVGFCGKFISRKRPGDALKAFALAQARNSHLIMVGDGPMRERLCSEARELDIADRTHFLGIVKLSELPRVYAACDLVVVPSWHEPWGLVVNEAMVCGRPIAASDRVGAAHDLVRQGETGFIYPCGDVEALARILRAALADRARLRRMGEAARRRMETWSPRENVEALVTAVEKAVALKKAGRG
jgi:glycosyltransferase involved in cell wall biosynthesis